jgi:hypothetical protein
MIKSRTKVEINVASNATGPGGQRARGSVEGHVKSRDSKSECVVM